MTLADQVEYYLSVGKMLLEKDGFVTPVVIFGKGGEHVPFPLPMANEKQKELCKMLVREMILRTRPDLTVIITDTYVSKVRCASLEEKEKIMKDYQEGTVKSSARTEALVVDGGAIGQRYSVVQPYERKGKKIVFQERMEPAKYGYIENTFFSDAWDILEAEGAVKQ